jgi:hypothetical protein
MAGNSSNRDPNAGVKDAAEQAAEARTAGAKTADGVVDARLDSRTGSDRPPVTEHPAVPQQIDGPDIEHHDEFVRKQIAAGVANTADAGAAKDSRGAHATGPHGEGNDPYEPHSRDGSAEGEVPKKGTRFSSRRH